MTYFPDLSPYRYDEFRNVAGLEDGAAREDVEALRAARNVGWLQGGVRFPRGATQADFRKRLFGLCRHARWGHRGIHVCNVGWCRLLPMSRRARRQGTVVRLGFHVLIVRGRDRIFAAPDLIYHYVVWHKYRPPDAFVEAVLAVALRYETGSR